MIKIKVKDEIKSLCDTCEYGLAPRNHDGKKLFTRCIVSSGKAIVISDDVKSCSTYKCEFLSPSYEITSIAWILEVKRGKIIGFKSPLENKEND